jgi:hypothetical protein
MYACRVGHHQRQIRRCFAAANGAAVRTKELIDRCYVNPPLRFERWHRNSVLRAAHRFGTNIRRGWWQANPELMRKIRGE